jgi:hypothetical protein
MNWTIASCFIPIATARFTILISTGRRCVRPLRTFEMLEPRLGGNRGKLARTVLRGLGAVMPSGYPAVQASPREGQQRSEAIQLMRPELARQTFATPAA